MRTTEKHHLLVNVHHPGLDVPPSSCVCPDNTNTCRVERIEYKLGVVVFAYLVSAWPGASVPRWSPHPSLWCCSSPSSSTIR